MQMLSSLRQSWNIMGWWTVSLKSKQTLALWMEKGGSESYHTMISSHLPMAATSALPTCARFISTTNYYHNLVETWKYERNFLCFSCWFVATKHARDFIKRNDHLLSSFTTGSGHGKGKDLCVCRGEEEVHLSRGWKCWFLLRFEAWRRGLPDAQKELPHLGDYLQ